MKSYVIDHIDESKRLNFQNTIDVYSLDEELKFFKFNSQDTVLDAGCGNGNVIEKLLKKGISKIHGIDFSEDRVKQASERFFNHSNVHIFNQPLDQMNFSDSSYDAIICRYVFEHVLNHQAILNELYRVLKPKSLINIINFDDIFFNFYTKNEPFNKCLKELQEKLPLDLKIGRKLPQMLKKSNFERIEWEANTYFFKGERLALEKENSRMRLDQGRNHLLKYFKNIEDYNRFTRIYLEEMEDENNVLSMTKYLIKATKPDFGKVLKF